MATLMTKEEREDFIEQVRQAAQSANHLTDEQYQWVMLAIKAESRKIKFRDAVIEKTLSGLIWACIIGVGAILAEFARNHGFK